MNITYDPSKDELNKVKHDLSLADAVYLDWDELLVKLDTRRDYGEAREIGYGLIDDRLHCVVFVQRAQLRHVISLRKANSREVKAYESQT